jgi:hypothetical protein
MVEFTEKQSGLTFRALFVFGERGENQPQFRLLMQFRDNEVQLDSGTCEFR